MIGFFPQPYEDELSYSWFARYLVCTGYTSAADVYLDLYGKKNIRPSVELLNDLQGEVKEVLQKYKPLKQIILEHTMFPEYARFIDPDKRDRLLEECDFTRGNWINNLMIPVSSKERHLKYCPMCVKEDREQYGETYWHRMHQINGITICVKHKLYLQDSSIVINRNLTRLKPAEIIIQQSEDSCPCEDEVIIKLAEYMDCVFSSDKYSHDKIGRILNNSLQSQYIHGNGDRKISTLYEEYRAFYKGLNDNDLMTLNLMSRILSGGKAAFSFVCQMGLFEDIASDELLKAGDSTGDKDIFIRVSEATGQPLDQVELIGKAVIDELKHTNGRISRKARHNDALDKDDIGLLPVVKQAAKDIYGDGSKRPKRVTVTAVARAVEIDSHRLKKMRRCMEVIDGFYETQEHYWAREIAWAVKEIEKNGDKLNYKHIRNLTNLKKSDIKKIYDEIHSINLKIYSMLLGIM